MSPTKLESNHLRKIKNIGKHKLKINLGSLAGRWEAIKKWLVGTAVLFMVFLGGFIIGKYHFSQHPELVGQPSDLTVKSDLKPNHPENGQMSKNNPVKSLETLNQTVSPQFQVDHTETAKTNGTNGSVEKPPFGQAVELNPKESNSKPSPVLSVGTAQTVKPDPVSSHQSDSTFSKPVTPPAKEELSTPKPAAVASKSDALVKKSAPSPSMGGLRESLQKCENLVKKNRLVPDKVNKKAAKKENEETALDCYQQVLKQDSKNVQATAGLKKLEDHYQTLIETALKKRQLDDGRRYLSELQKVNPKSLVLPVAERRLKELATLASDKNEIPMLLKQCGEHLKAGRLLSGKGGTAFECYNQVLVKAPNHQEAKAGLRKIETRYQQLAETFLKQKQLSKARSALQNLQQVNPNSPKLAELQQRLNTLEQSVISSRPSSTLSPPPVRPSVPPVSSPVPVVAPPSEKLPARVHKPAREQESPPSSATVQTPPQPPTSQRQPSRCSEIFIQESLGIQPLTAEEREFKKKFCN